MKNRNVHSPASVDEYSVLEFRIETTPKMEYTRSQLLDLGSNACALNIDNDELSTKLFEKNIVRDGPVKLIDKLNNKTATDAANEQKLNDDFWSKATTSNQNERQGSYSQEQTVSDYQAVLAKAALDNRFVLPFSNNSKVDRWLNSGQNPTEYAKATVNDSVLTSFDPTHANKPDESASTISTKSAIRAQLLDRTAKVKQTLRNLTNNN